MLNIKNHKNFNTKNIKVDNEKTALFILSTETWDLHVITVGIMRLVNCLKFDISIAI